MNGDADPPRSETSTAAVLLIAVRLRRVGQGLTIIVDGPVGPGRAAKAHPKLIRLIARAHHFRDVLSTSQATQIADVAKAEGLTGSYFTRVMRLAYLAPDITQAILAGQQPAELTADKLMGRSRLPLVWQEQRRLLGFI